MYDNFGVISNTRINSNGHSVNFHYNSMSPWNSCCGFGNFSTSCFGFGYPQTIYGFNNYGFGYNPKVALGVGLGFGLGIAMPRIINGIIGLFKKN